MALARPDIYVQIPSYRDDELSATVHSLYTAAARPERLRVRVLWQLGPGDDLTAVTQFPTLEVQSVNSTASRGPNWARRILQDGWQGESYTLLLDSHHRFSTDWDDMLVGAYDRLLAMGVRKPLLSGYLPPYDPSNDPAGRKVDVWGVGAVGRQDGVLTRLGGFSIPEWRVLTSPVEGNFLSLHFLFADGSYNRTIVSDPEVYFFGDEVLTSLRAFTYGYRIFHPHAPLAWHLYDRRTRITHFEDHSDWSSLQARSLARLRMIYSAEDTSLLGKEGTVSEFEERIGCRLVDQGVLA